MSKAIKFKDQEIKTMLLDDAEVRCIPINIKLSSNTIKLVYETHYNNYICKELLTFNEDGKVSCLHEGRIKKKEDNNNERSE